MFPNSLKSNSWWAWGIKLLLLCAVLGIIFLFGETLYEDWSRIQAWVESQGPWAPAIYITLLVLLPTIFFPTDPLCFFGGALFGLAWGAFYALLGMVISATLMFFLSQHLLRDWLVKKLNDQPKLRRLDRVIQSGGFFALLLLRILPIPFAPLSYFLGMTGVKFRDYFWTIFGTMGSVILGVYYGSVASHMARLGGKDHLWQPGDLLHIFFWLALFILLATGTHLAQKKLKALEEKSPSH